MTAVSEVINVSGEDVSISARGTGLVCLRKERIETIFGPQKRSIRPELAGFSPERILHQPQPVVRPKRKQRPTTRLATITPEPDLLVNKACKTLNPVQDGLNF
jgi:hypothetical protein